MTDRDGGPEARTRRAVVTGGAGFLGSHFVRAWIRDGRGPLCNVDLLTYAGSRERLSDVAGHRDYSFRNGDVADPVMMRAVLTDFRPEVLVHFAAESHVTQSESHPDIFWRTNVEGTLVTLLAAAAGGVRRFIYVSTDEVYGAVPTGYRREEDKPRGAAQTSSPYARSKAIADDMACGFRGAMRVNVVRPTNCFGPWQHPEKAFARWITKALTGQALPVWGDGLYVRQWLFVDDLIRALFAVLDATNPEQVYNVGPRHVPEITNLALARWLLRYLELPESRLAFTAYDRPNHDRRYAVDASRIKDLGWYPRDVWGQFAATVDWYKTFDWWRPLVPEAEAIYADVVPAR
jgi:dTDP-glucose 4,6-dehydratase